VFADAGSNDTHTASIAWGDSTVTTGTVNDPSHSVTGTHAFPVPGLYTVNLTVTDDDTGAVSRSQDILVNGAPTANANGPYNGDEGSTIHLSGTATDSDSPSLTTTWAFTPGPADPGLSCSYTGTTTLTPTVTCNDDVTVNAVLTVSDGINPPVSSSTTVAVTNVAPVVAPINTTPSPVRPGQTVSLTAPFSDAGTNDAHVATIDWGDLTTTSGTVSEVLGSGTASGTHTYALPGIYTVTVTVTDHDGAFDTRSTTIRVNSAPTADAGGTYVGLEGSPMTLTGTASDPDGDPLTTSWSISWTGEPGTVCTATGTSGLSPQITCNDDATVTAVLSVSDGINAPVTSTATLLVGNQAPTAGTVTTSPTVVPVGTSVSTSVPFADPGTNDTHTATIDWGDSSTSAGTVTETLGAGTVSGSHVYSSAGTYTLSITINDDDLGSVVATSLAYIVVYDPSGGFVTGGTHFDSPSGAYTPDNPSDPDLEGRADVAFVAKYLPGDTVPSGNTEFQFKTADLNFKATGFSWLVVDSTGTKAYFRGSGQVNGVDGYDFLVSVIDGTPDMLRIKVWDDTTSAVLYDNQPGAADDADPTTPVSGSIMIHT
jgi:PKD repeat protein